MYDAQDIAEFIIAFCEDQGYPITNLKLQKLLYFLWIDYYKDKGDYLFDDSFYAWKLGPVVPDVYYRYNVFSAMPIEAPSNYISALDPDDEEFLSTKIADNYLDVPASVLVGRTHNSGTAWDTVYDNGSGFGKEIPFTRIILNECVKPRRNDRRGIRKRGLISPRQQVYRKV